MSGTPEICWQPDPEVAAHTAMTGFARFLGERRGEIYDDYAGLWRASVDHPGEFWQAIADHFELRWHGQPTEALGGSVINVDADGRQTFEPGALWFTGGTLNYAEHALAFGARGGVDRDGAARDASEIAVIETDESGFERAVTIGELRAMVGAAQAGLRRCGVGRGDRVVALAPNRLEALVAFLATAALGAVWSSCSPEFGASSVIDRFTQVTPTVLIAVDGYRYGGREFDISATVAELRAALPGLSATVHIPALGSPVPAGAVAWAELVAEPGEVTFEPVGFNDPLWVLYSSGTTGLPKAIVHSVGGILVEHLKMLALHQDLGPGKRFFWFTTTGWMMWNYLVGGLLVGSTIVLYDGNPGTPDLMTLWRLAARHRIDCVGVSAAFIHACRAAGLAPGGELDLSCVTSVGSTGSPLSADGFDWIMQHIGPQVLVASVSGGTDVCTAIVGAAPTVPVWRGEIPVRALGARVEAWNEAGKSVLCQVGELVITAPMPSMPIYFWGDADGSKMRAAYFEHFPGVWRHGDWIRITDRGSVIIEGRSDATLNRGGVRMGTAEFYRVVEDLPGVVDSLVVDTSSPAGEGDLVLFVVLADGVHATAVAAEITSAVRSALSPRHVPGRIVPVPAIPRTINGKKCEVPVKRILAGARPADVISRDALADPAAFDDFLRAASVPLDR